MISLALLVALHGGCSSDPAAVPPTSITVSAVRVGLPWFVTYAPTASVTGGQGDAVVWFGSAQVPVPLPIPGCTADVDPMLFVPHLFPLRGNYVIAVMPTIPQDRCLIGLPFSVQSFIACHLPGRADVLLGTNSVSVTIED